MTETKIARYGNSLTVRVPAALARELDFHEGDVVTVRRIDRGIAVERNPRSELDALLATVHESEAEEWGTGSALGNEVFE